MLAGQIGYMRRLRDMIKSEDMLDFTMGGNLYDKYNSKNFLIRRMMQGFFAAYQGLLKNVVYENVMEAGCGEGYISDFIYHLRPVSIRAFDISPEVITVAQKKMPYISFHTGSIYQIESESKEYDLVVASEVLEHLEDPAAALRELMRISRKYIIVSVPRESIWRILNCCRGKYLCDFGNTPGHIQHWSKGQFIQFLKTTVQEQFEIVQTESPLPWTVVLMKVYKEE